MHCRHRLCLLWTVAVPGRFCPWWARAFHLFSGAVFVSSSFTFFILSALSLSSFCLLGSSFLPERTTGVWLTAGLSVEDGGLWVRFGSFWVLHEVWFRPLFCAIFWVCSIGFNWVLGFVFFSFFPIFSLDSCYIWSGCSVIHCVFDFSGVGIQ